MLHRNSLLNHKIENYTYATGAARAAATGFVTADLGKIAYQSDDGSYWRLTATTPTWVSASIPQKLESYTYATAALRAAATGFVAGDLGKIAFQSDDKSYWRLTATTPTWASLQIPQKLESYTYANAAARTAATGFVAGDLGKVAYQSDDGSYWRLTATTPTWAAIGSGGGSSSGGYRGTSATSATIGTETQTFTTQSGLDYYAHQRVRIYSSAAPSTNYMEGRVVSYSSTTLVVWVDYLKGSGAHTDWVIVDQGIGGIGYIVTGGTTHGSSTLEKVHASMKFLPNQMGTRVLGVRFKLWGTITNGTTVCTFTPRLRWDVDDATVTGTLILTGPLVVGTTTALSEKAWEIEGLLVFSGDTTTKLVRATMSVKDHTTSSAGAFTQDFTNTGIAASDVALDSLILERNLNLTWQESTVTGSPNIKTLGGVWELIDAANSDS